MKLQGLALVGVMLLCGTAFAGTATFSGSTNDTDELLAGVVYDGFGCSFVLGAGDTAGISSQLGDYPYLDEAGTTITCEFAWNPSTGPSTSAGISLEITKFVAPYPLMGVLEMVLDNQSVSLVFAPNDGGPVEVLRQVAGLTDPTSLELGITATEMTLGYSHAGGTDTFTALDLTNVGSLGDVKSTAYIMDFAVIANGDDWQIDEIEWTGPSVADTNEVGCDQPVLPDLAGQTEAQATTALTPLGLTLEVTAEEYSDLVVKDLIIRQTPDPGRPVKIGTGVNISPAEGNTTLIGVVISLGDPLADTDEDGLPDAWEKQYFSDPVRYPSGYLSLNGWDDPDGDGKRNIEEYNVRSKLHLVLSDPEDPDSPLVQGGTDPTDPTSAVPASKPYGLVLLSLILCTTAGTIVAKRKFS